MYKNLFKKAGYLSLASAIALTSTGCSVKEVDRQSSIEEIKKLVKDYKPQKQLPIEEIKISGYTLKKSNLNKKITNDYFIKMNLVDKHLGDLTKIGEYTIIVDPLIQNRIINLNNGIESGKISEVLDKIAFTTNTYWTYDKGVIKFVKTAEILYTFPALSLTKISEVYNVGESEMASNMNLKESLFTDLSDVIAGLVESYSIEGEIVHSNADTIQTKKDTTNSTANNSENSDTKILSKSGKSEESKDNNVEEKSQNQSNSDFNVDLSPVDNAVFANPKEGAQRAVGETKKAKGDSLLNKRNNVNINDSKVIDRSLSATNNDSSTKDSNLDTTIKANKSEKNNTYLNEKTIKMTETFKSSAKRIVISQNSGTIIASLTPSEESVLDTVLNTVMEKRFGNMIRLKTYALVVEAEKAKSFNAEFSSLIQYNGYSIPMSIGGGNFGFTVPQRGVTDTESLFNAMVQYLVSDREGQVLINPSIVALPNVITRIQDTSNIPYLEPTDLGNDNGTVSYGINYVKEGVNMSAIANVFDDNIIMALKFSITQYLGSKTIAAGILGSFDLPLSAPKIIQTTYRVSPGDILVLGGLKQSKYNKNGEDSFFIPTGLENSSSKNEFIFIVMPTLIKFVVEKEEDKRTSIKDLSGIELSEEKNRMLQDKMNGKKNTTENIRVIKSNEVVEVTSVEEVISESEVKVEEPKQIVEAKMEETEAPVLEIEKPLEVKEENKTETFKDTTTFELKK